MSSASAPTRVTYDPAQIEPKWQAFWDEQGSFKTVEHAKGADGREKPKYYVLDMFPYPSGDGLHVGHPEGYTATDIMARYKRMQGFNVLHPMGWDAFGLPAEQYAIKTGQPPAEITAKNIANFKRQIKSLGLSYDWTREISTAEPDYFKWTQWIFLKLHEAGLAYEAHMSVNWCEALGTVLANEEIVDGKSERGGHPVVRKPMRQWILKITQYAERLLEDLDGLDWPEHIKEMQRNWIGRSVGARVRFAVRGQADSSFEVFTTRADTLFGATYCVLAPEHPMVEGITTPEHAKAVAAYRDEAARKSDLERTDLAGKNKTGVFTGAYAINPANQKAIPIWISDYVLATYGTGAIMAVPGHDQRDWDFAKAMGLPIVEVLQGGDVAEAAFEGDGPHVNSAFLDGLGKAEAIAKMNAWLEAEGHGKAETTYRLRDWLFSRQRYWGEPIPLLHLEDGSIKALDPSELPLTLPHLDRIQPSGTGESPLVLAPDWVNTTDPATGQAAKRETNTMPQWAGSCWYYLRFCDARNPEAFADFEKLKFWLPVDLYVGGAEHAVMHLLYARFWHKVLYDLKLVPGKEPFAKLFNQGMILGENGEKMSKSRGNVINPDVVVAEHGADTLRLYEMFMGPLEASKPWATNGVDGVHRFLARAWRLFVAEDGSLNPTIGEVDAPELRRTLHKTIAKVGPDIENLRFNTAIAQMMIFVNEATKSPALPRDLMLDFIKVLSPFAPHLGEELWERMGQKEALAYTPWPAFNPELIKEAEVELAVQVNGKIKAKIVVASDAASEAILASAKEAVAADLAGMVIRKEVVVPGRLVNLVVSPA